MAWSVDDIYKELLFLTRSNQSGRISATDLFYAWNTEQNAYHSDLLGKWQARNNGKEGVNTGLILDETISTLLAPFTLPASITLVSGVATLPSDYIYGLGGLRLSVSSVEYPVKVINHNQIPSVNADVIDPPSITDHKYYVVAYGDYYQFLPSTSAGALKLDYIAACRDIVWAYTWDANNRQVYSPSGLTGLDVIYGGVGYTTPTITFSAPAAGGVQATGTLTIVGGVITRVVMTNVGTGYAGLTPTFTITGSSTTPASFGSPKVSVQPRWNQNTIIEITKRTLTSFGVSLKDKDFENFGAKNTVTGDS